MLEIPDKGTHEKLPKSYVIKDNERCMCPGK